MIKKLRATKPNVLLVDAGDVFPKTPMDIKTEYTLRSYALMNYDAIAIGDQEFTFGAGELERWIKRSYLPFISTNINKPLGLPLCEREVKREIAGVRVVIFAVVSPEVFDEEAMERVKPCRVLDPVGVLRDRLSRARGEADIVIVLSHSGLERDKELARKVSGIDIIVGAHSGDLLTKPVRVGKTIILQPGRNGEYLGVLTIGLDERGRIRDYDNRLIALTDMIPRDEEAAQVAREYREAVLKALGKKPLEPPPPEVVEYVPAGECGRCHEKQLQSWSRTAHAHAYETIRKKNREDEIECLFCHTTGFGKETGFRNIEATLQLAGVGCQCCHPLNAAHADDKNNIRRSGPVRSIACEQCHTEINSPDFNFSSYVRRIQH